ncbi:MAG: hypothetical protein WCI75_16735, partial [candidate division NC10 bacterium]
MYRAWILLAMTAALWLPATAALAPATQSASAPSTRPKRSLDDYRLIVERNIFSRDRARRTFVARPSAGPPPTRPLSQRHLVLTGVALQGEAPMAFFEDSLDGQTLWVQVGMPIGHGVVADISLDGVSYRNGKNERTIAIGEDMEGIAVQDVAFDPAEPLKMVLATQSGQVFRSSDGGDHWTEVLKPPLSTIAAIANNPHRPTEVWIGSYQPGQMYKCTDAAFTSWQDVTPPLGHFFTLSFMTFTSADSVYTTRNHSTDGGLTWQVLGPATVRAGE